ncbi:MAG: N-acetylmuramoyl-L-alanine amidase [Woeseiaceae bacterium]
MNKKNYPDRYPVNSDSIGIEIVVKFINDTKYEDLTAAQNVSLQWLISELYGHFNLDTTDVYRHPEVSYKMPSEGSTAVWR